MARWPSLEERLWANIDKSGDCWLWQGHVDSNGYPQIRADGVKDMVYRVVYRLLVGPIPEGQVIMHKCDTPRCCNPDHLVAGTQMQNLQDCKAKGRNARGSRHGLSKLTDDQVAYIHASPKSQQKVADELGVSRSLVGLIRQGKRRAA